VRPSRRRIEALPVIALLAVLGATGQAIELHVPGIEAASLHGYYKNFFLDLDSSDALLKSGQEDLNRGRLMLEGQLTKSIDFAVHYEHLLTIHPLNDTGIFLGTAGGERKPGIWPLSWSLGTWGSVRWRHEIDRLFVRRRAEWGDVTVGRQAIGWGAGLIWSPEDLFVAFSPVEIDREFRAGVDAARVLASLGPFTEAEAVYAVFGDGVDNHAAAVRWRTTLAGPGVDVGLMAGKFYQDAVGGGLLSGEISGVGVHAEATATHDFQGSRTRVGVQDFARAVVGADYRFPGEVRVVGEYYFNGFGTSDPRHYLDLATSPRLARGEIFNLGRHYVGFIADWEAHPLLHLGAQGEWNLEDPSAFVGPTFTLSLSDNAQLDGGAYFALGAERRSDLALGSEFGSAPNLFYAAGKVYF
jgi:hypothetical protein